MQIIVHISTFIVAVAVTWFFAGLLIGSVDRIARRFQRSDFTVAFFLLGFLTSISEISVAVNSGIEMVPQVSVGNLIGASFVILFFLLPLLAVAGKGVALKNTLSKRNLALALGFILLPALLILDGNVTRAEGVIVLIAYLTIMYLVRGERSPLKEVIKVEEELLSKSKTAWDLVKVAIGALLIFVAGHFLVQETVFFATLLGVPNSLIGLILLSVGTNIPEIAIAIRAVAKKHKDIAFGDYLGSMVANTTVFGILALTSGTFRVVTNEFIVTTLIMILGIVSFYMFASSHNKISRNEGWALFAFYGAFLVLQFVNLAHFVTD